MMLLHDFIAFWIVVCLFGEALRFGRVVVRVFASVFTCDGILRFHHRASLSCGGKEAVVVVVVVVFNFCIAKASFASRFCRAPRETMETQFGKKKGHVFLRLPLFKELFRLARAIRFNHEQRCGCYGMTGVPLLKNTRMINLQVFFCI